MTNLTKEQIISELQKVFITKNPPALEVVINSVRCFYFCTNDYPVNNEFKLKNRMSDTNYFYINTSKIETIQILNTDSNLEFIKQQGLFL
jgi:hypothetical protein